MALGFSSKAKAAEANQNGTEKAPKYDYDPENPEGGRRASRVAGVARQNMTDSDSDLTVGKQMELEAGNAIKYRTCSWQKVCS